MSELGFSPDTSETSQQLPLADQIKNQDRGSISIMTERGNEINVTWRRFLPLAKAPDAVNKAVMYIPGWVMQADAVSVEDLPQAFADASGTLAFAIDTHSKTPQDDYREDMRATVKWILASGIKDWTFAGHSNGAIKAVELALLLKELRGTDQEIKINGLVLMDSTHMYDQNPAILAANTIKVGAQEKIYEEPNKASRAAGPELIKALKERINYSGRIGYLKVFLNQLRDMSRINPRVSEIDVPVVAFTSDKNPIANYKKVAPVNALSVRPFKTTQAQREAMTEQQRLQREQRTTANLQNAVENKHKRQQYLQENRFTSTPNIHVIVPRGYHNTLPVRRFESTAKAGLYYLGQLAYQRGRAAETK